jgi:alkylated DNA nucleotide flippase Atl1
MTVYQFTDAQSLHAGTAKIRVAYPKGQMTTYGPVVILATGPNAAQYLADVKKVIPATG